MSSDSLTEKFREVWPAVAPPLRRYIASLGAQPADIDDIVQEVAARALHRRVWFADAADLRRWAFVVARHVRVDQLRAAARVLPLDAVAATTDAHATRELSRVEDRHVLATVRDAIASLSPADHRALADAGPVADLAARNRAAVARHRARTRLRRIVGPLSAVLAWVGAHRGRDAAPVLAAASSLALAAAVLYGSPPGAGASEPDVTAQQQTSTVGTWARATPVAGVRLHAPAGVDGHGQLVHGQVAAAAVPSREALPMMRADGPAGAWVKAGLQHNDGEQPLVCIEGPVVGKACAPSPTTSRTPLPVGR